ncbi:hypothetical protein BHE74_00007899 [Ensete ventricosum]|nr:hypothetical protein B296_00012298 [Ensete ventricosum]RWW83584.1 hypothetical protein BHE74_00007899 [Ensete ventricosum]
MGSAAENGTLRHYFDHESESESDGGRSVGHSGPLGGPLASKKAGKKRSARFKGDDNYVEITLDVRDDAIAIQSIQSGHPEAALLARNLERRSPVVGASLSSKLKQVGHELRRMTSSSRRAERLDRTKSSAAQAIKGLQFVTKNVASEGWPQVERRFDELAVDGVLLRSRFGKCVGMVGSEEFAGEVFDALARRRGITAAVLKKEELREFWEQLSDQSFDARLQTFFDM